MAEDYREIVRRRVLDETTFVQMTLKGKQPGAGDLPWRKVTVRPVLIKNRRHLQFSHFTGKQDFTKNYSGAEAVAHLDEILALPFSSIVVRSTDEDLQVQINRPGKAILRRERPAEARAPELAHDAAKDLPIPADKPDPFLQATGIQTADGRIKADMRGKFAQINEFLKLLEHTGALETFDHTPLHILDCGCGSSYLSFATYHYVNDLKGIPARLVGVDTNGRLIDKSNAASADLGLTDVCFIRSPIADYQPDVPPDIVLALHACDTATDDALALAVRHNADHVALVPCCQAEVARQLAEGRAADPVLAELHGRPWHRREFGSHLTNVIRALALEAAGYRVTVTELTGWEHSLKNELILGEKVRAQNPAARERLAALLRATGVTPKVVRLLEMVPAGAPG